MSLIKNFKPGIGLTLCTALVLLVLLSLGSWQLQRLGPKTALLERIEQGLKADPISLPLHADDPSGLEYHHVYFSGTRIAEPVKVFGISNAGKSGYFLYAPVKREHGMAVIVNFGWVPYALEHIPTLPVDIRRLTGVLQKSAVAGPMTPENDPARGEWYLADVYEMAAHFGLKTKEYYHFRVFADKSEEVGSLPIGGQVRVSIPNNHFEYALTWYGLALALLGVYITFGYKRGRKAA